MNCTKCGKEIPEGEKKICDDCQKQLLDELEKENQDENILDAKTESIDNTIEESHEENNERKTISKITIIILFVFIIIACALYFFFSKNIIGNSIGNIRNYGYTTEQAGWIYYIAPSEDASAISIYKSKKDGTDKQELVKDDWDVLGLNVVGDYIYFIGITNDEIEKSSTLVSSESSEDTLNNKIYRMKLDGSELEVINSNEFHNNCYEIYVIKDKIYYIGVDQNIYYMDLDGSNKTKLNDDKTGFLGITNDYIILNLEKETGENKESSTTETTYETYIMNIDGTEKKSLTGERIYSVNIVNDYIYYTDSNKAIYKIKTDGTEKTLISDSVNAYNMNVTEDKIFYMSYTNELQNKIAIYAMNLDGSDNKLIYELDNYSSFLNTIDNNVIFMDSNEKSATINMINSIGEDKVILYELERKETNETNQSEIVTDENSNQNTTDVQNADVK